MKPQCVRMLGWGLIAGFLSALAWDLVMRGGRSGGPAGFFVGLFFDLWPGMVYSAAVTFGKSRDAAKEMTSPLRLTITTLVGGFSFIAAVLVTGVTFAMLAWGAPMLGGFVGSLAFGSAAARLLHWDRRPARLACYAITGAVVSLAFVPLCTLLARGPDTPSLHHSLYLAFPVWQGATAAVLSLFNPKPEITKDALDEL